ncbi:hypothetical protein ACIQTZ_20590 [Paenarthrobacter sp. NPDC090520]|uniref:hypothetical protein n=1 Tax=Paenarthrobacter sp. NPDC090520 TaxID=3364382 RepID=UPI0038156B0A
MRFVTDVVQEHIDLLARHSVGVISTYQRLSIDHRQVYGHLMPHALHDDTDVGTV